MFFNEESKIKIYCVIFDKSLYPPFVECVRRCNRPLASRTGHEASGDTASMLGHVFDHQASPTRHRRPPEPPARPSQAPKRINRRFTLGADLGPTFSENLQNHGFSKDFVHLEVPNVEQAARAASEGRVSGA